MLADAASYTCQIGDANHPSVDPYFFPIPAVLSVANHMTIDTQPVGASLYVGEPYSASVAVSGGLGTVNFQWRKDGTDIGGANASTYNIGAVALGDAGTYTCHVTDASEALDSAGALLAVAAHVSITTQPAPGDKYIGQSHVFTVVAAGGKGALHYQWRKDGTNIGTDSPTYSIPNLALSDAGNYDCIVTDEGTDSVPSATANLIVRSVFAIDQQPAGGDVYVGAAYTFTVTTVFEVGAVSYQWYKDGTAITDATSASLAINPAALGDAGSYYVTATDDRGTPTNPADDLMRTSVTVNLVVGEHMAITQQPLGLTVNEGQAASFSVTVTGGLGTLTYQWQKDGVDITDATNSSYAIAATVLGDAGSFSCIISDAYEQLPSDPAALVVEQGSQVPAAGVAGLAALALLSALAGAASIRRRK